MRILFLLLDGNWGLEISRQSWLVISASHVGWIFPLRSNSVDIKDLDESPTTAPSTLATSAGRSLLPCCRKDMLPWGRRSIATLVGIRYPPMTRTAYSWSWTEYGSGKNERAPDSADYIRTSILWSWRDKIQTCYYTQIKTGSDLMIPSSDL